MPLSKAHNLSQKSGVLVASCAETQVQGSMGSVERIVSVLWLRSCGEEVALWWNQTICTESG